MRSVRSCAVLELIDSARKSSTNSMTMRCPGCFFAFLSTISKPMLSHLPGLETFLQMPDLLLCLRLRKDDDNDGGCGIAFVDATPAVLPSREQPAALSQSLYIHKTVHLCLLESQTVAA